MKSNFLNESYFYKQKLLYQTFQLFYFLKIFYLQLLFLGGEQPLEEVLSHHNVRMSQDDADSLHHPGHLEQLHPVLSLRVSILLLVGLYRLVELVLDMFVLEGEL